MINANDYKADVYSQNGEDGIIEFLYTQIEPTGFVIEFGAADGLFCSNTANLWRKEDGAQALLIESDPTLFSELEKVASDWDVEAVNALVQNIDDFTTRVADVCSIDIDGDDHQVAEAMQIKHQIVVIEYNPTVPPHVDMIGIQGAQYGSGAKSITRLMTRKGYTLVAVTKTNLFFLFGDHSDKFVTDLNTLFDYSSLNYVVTSYTGEYDMIGEFGYGFGRPADMGLRGRLEEISYTTDTDTLERVRQLLYLDRKKLNRRIAE